MIVVAVVATAANVVVIASVSARAPLWVPAVLVGGCAVLLALARPLGDRFRPTDVPMVDVRDQVLLGQDVIRRKVTKIGVTFVVAALLTAVGVTALNAFGGSRPHEAVIGILLAGQLTFLTTAFAEIFVALPFSRMLRDAGGRDIDRLRRYAKLALRGKGSPVAADDRKSGVRSRKPLLRPIIKCDIAPDIQCDPSVALTNGGDDLVGHEEVISSLLTSYSGVPILRMNSEIPVRAATTPSAARGNHRPVRPSLCRRTPKIPPTATAAIPPKKDNPMLVYHGPFPHPWRDPVQQSP